MTHNHLNPWWQFNTPAMDYTQSPDWYAGGGVSAGKGDKPRPFSVPLSHYESEMDRIFGGKDARQDDSDGDGRDPEGHEPVGG